VSRPALPRGVFARLAFLSVASADRDGGMCDGSPRPFLTESEALDLAEEASRAYEDAEALGATPKHWVEFGRWLRDSR
jgi:hypothetical protein